MNTGLRTTQLSYARNNHLLLNQLNIQVKPGEALVVSGPNGSGKTSLLRVLTGLLTGYMGSILWNDQPIADTLTSYHQALHYLGHYSGIKNKLSVKENMAYSQALSGSPCSDRKVQMEAALQTVGLEDRQAILAQHLSAGQKRRLALARLLASPKPLWILDEPFTFLDQDSQQLFRELLQQHLRTQGMAVVATHQPLQLIEPVVLTLLQLQGPAAHV